MIVFKVWEIYDQIGRNAAASGDLTLARKMYSEAIESCASDKKLLPQKLQSIIGLADAHIAEKDDRGALRIYNRALNAIARAGSRSAVENSLLAHALEQIAHIQSRRGDSLAALKAMQRSLRVTEELLGSVHPSLPRKLLALSVLHTQSGDQAAAIDCLERARALKKAAQGLVS